VKLTKVLTIYHSWIHPSIIFLYSSLPPFLKYKFYFFIKFFIIFYLEILNKFTMFEILYFPEIAQYSVFLLITYFLFCSFLIVFCFFILIYLLKDILGAKDTSWRFWDVRIKKNPRLDLPFIISWTLFILGGGGWYWGLNSVPTPWITPPALFCDGFFPGKFLWTVCPSWLQIAILLISASWVGKIKGVSHQHQAWTLYINVFLIFFFIII
jgi:hypothetical protein